MSDLRSRVKGFSVSKLVSLFDETNGRVMSLELADVRGAIMDELESRNPVAFGRWVDSLEDSPKEYFL